MSANRWSICPKCRITNELTREGLRQMVAAQYGKIDPEEWIKARDAADKPVELEETFREDFQQGMTEDGEYIVSYSGRCIACSFAHKFSHNEQVFKVETNIVMPSRPTSGKEKRS